MKPRPAMGWLSRFGWWVVALGCANLAAMSQAADRALQWDAVEKNYAAKPGQPEAEIAFAVTNRSAHAVELRDAITSCRCTMAEFPRKPWVLAPGEAGTVTVRVDLRSRRGGLTKTIYIDTSEGEELLQVHVDVPPPPAVQREMNLMAAQADRQAVLRGDCASCHVAPAMEKRGAELFAAACLVCHGAAHRATMVPDLTAPTTTRDAAYWEKWIRDGGEGTLMPAWAKANGGPLDDEQIASLVSYVLKALPTQPVVK